ncbi:hypothetical protein BHE90_014211 [Fusarium euwallaceae]|uniref:Uncharacterized protein n=1 Tax=Fusarium euwallaceae TaxID=1147111 RepID=A0A430L6K6_9HYPO|nr:hypothetical protein BHE90_014211 [Fusarium euwallaceae]
MAGPSPNIPSLFELREFHFRSQWTGGPCAGGGLLFLNNDRIVSAIHQTKHQSQILQYLETTKFKDFETNCSKIQQHLLKFDGGRQGYLSVRFIPQRIQLTAEPGAVVWNDDSLGGSVIDAVDLCETPDSYELSSESRPTSVPCSVASSEEVIYRAQPSPAEQTTLYSPPRSPQVPTTSTSDVPQNSARVKSRLWSGEEDKLVTNMLMGMSPISEAGFPGRTPSAIRSRSKVIRRKLIADGHKPLQWQLSPNYKRQTYITIAIMFEEGKSEDDVIEALPGASGEVIRFEFRYLKEDSGKDIDREVKAWLEENVRARWLDIRHRFPGFGIRQFERVCWRLKEGHKTQGLSKILWK